MKKLTYTQKVIAYLRNRRILRLDAKITELDAMNIYLGRMTMPNGCQPEYMIMAIAKRLGRIAKLQTQLTHLKNKMHKETQ